MSADIDPWKVPTEYPSAPAELGRVKFRDGEGGDMPRLWAEHMLRFWFEASKNNKRPSFSEALQNTVTHFMMGNQEP